MRVEHRCAMHVLKLGWLVGWNQGANYQPRCVRYLLKIVFCCAIALAALGAQPRGNGNYYGRSSLNRLIRLSCVNESDVFLWLTYRILLSGAPTKRIHILHSFYMYNRCKNQGILEKSSNILSVSLCMELTAVSALRSTPQFQTGIGTSSMPIFPIYLNDMQ